MARRTPDGEIRLIKVLFDTNVILDVLLNRLPWVTDSRNVWQAKDEGKIVGYMAASVLTDIFYISRRIKGLADAHEAVRICLTGFEIIPVDRSALEQAARLPGNDFADNLQIVCATFGGLNGIVTRDPSGFAAAPFPIWAPSDLLALL